MGPWTEPNPVASGHAVVSRKRRDVVKDASKRNDLRRCVTAANDKVSILMCEVLCVWMLGLQRLHFVRCAQSSRVCRSHESSSKGWKELDFGPKN